MEFGNAALLTAIWVVGDGGIEEGRSRDLIARKNSIVVKRFSQQDDCTES